MCIFPFLIPWNIESVPAQVCPVAWAYDCSTMSDWQSWLTDAHLRLEPLQDVGSLSRGLCCGWDIDPLSLQVLEAYFPKPCGKWYSEWGFWVRIRWSHKGGVPMMVLRTLYKKEEKPKSASLLCLPTCDTPIMKWWGGYSQMPWPCPRTAQPPGPWDKSLFL